MYVLHQVNKEIYATCTCTFMLITGESVTSTHYSSEAILGYYSARSPILIMDLPLKCLSVGHLVLCVLVGEVNRDMLSVSFQSP